MQKPPDQTDVASLSMKILELDGRFSSKTSIEQKKVLEVIGIDNLPSTTQMFAIRDRYRTELYESYKRSGLGPAATVGQLIEKTKPKVEIPIIKVSLKIGSALKMFVLGASIIMLYLLSCMTALRHIVRSNKNKEDDKGMEWVFFHHGILGPIIGIVWLFVPLGVTVGALVIKMGGILWMVVGMVSLAVLGGAVTFLSLSTRRTILQHSNGAVSNEDIAAG